MAARALAGGERALAEKERAMISARTKAALMSLLVIRNSLTPASGLKRSGEQRLLNMR
jgi:hypothetical protein